MKQRNDQPLLRLWSKKIQSGNVLVLQTKDWLLFVWTGQWWFVKCFFVLWFVTFKINRFFGSVAQEVHMIQKIALLLLVTLIGALNGYTSTVRLWNIQHGILSSVEYVN